MNITDFIGGGYKEMLGREAICEDCHKKFDPDWCADDNCGRDICQKCEIKRDNYEQELSDRKD